MAKHKYNKLFAARPRAKRSFWRAAWKPALLVLLAALAFLVSYAGGKGALPNWDALFRTAGLSNGSPAVTLSGSKTDEPTKIHFVDVGQGDAVLIEQDGQYAMIDCGTADCETALLSYLDQLGVKQLAVLVMTHPHADHVGSMDAVLRHCKVETLVLPVLSNATEYPTSASFEKVIAAAEDTDVRTVEAAVGQSYPVGSGTLSVIGTGIESEDYNNISVCTRFTAGAFAFLDTGDAEKECEQALLESGEPLAATVYKAGHHGSNTSNTLAFLQVVKPRAAVISCGLGNSYGHPHAEALEHFAAVGAEVYRTDIMGTVVAAYSPEKGLVMYVQKETEEAAA